MNYSIEDAQRALDITNALNSFIKNGREYEGDDEDSISLRDLLNKWNTDNLRDNVVEYMLRTEDDEGNPIPRMSGVMTADQTNDYFLTQLKGWDEMYEKMNAMRLMANKQEDERQKAEAAVEAQKEIAQKSVEDMKKLSEEQTEQLQNVQKSFKDIEKLLRIVNGDTTEEDKNGSQTDVGDMGVGGQAQQTMQQVAPDVAQSSPIPAPISPTPAESSIPPAPAEPLAPPAPPAPAEPPAPPAEPPAPAPAPAMPDASGGGGMGMPQGGIFEPSEGMLNAIQPRMGM